jgi:Bacterial conjugation TrbI-like protein
MRRFVRFFVIGPGAVLVVVVLVLGVGWIIKRGQDKERALAAKRQVQRQLGQVKPSDQVDKATAPKEVTLSNNRLEPPPAGEQSEQTPPPQVVHAQGPVHQQALSPLVSFYQAVAPASTPTPAPPRPKDVTAWLPPGIFIPCVLVNTVESSHLNTPVVGEVIRDVVQKNNGISHVIVPAGTLVNSFAQSGAVRDRIEVAGTWVLVYPDGRQLKVRGIACDREADPANQQFGIEDGSAGLQGDLIESDHWVNAKAFIALLMTAAMQTGTAVATSTLQAAHTTGVTALPDTTPILAKYLDQLLNGETGDGRFVRVRAGKEFYVYPTETIEPQHRTVSDSQSAENLSPAQSLSPAASEAVELEKQILKASQQPGEQNNSENQDRFHY